MADPISVKPGSCTVNTLRPLLSSRRSRRLTWVDLPDASPPSNVINKPAIPLPINERIAKHNREKRNVRELNEGSGTPAADCFLLFNSCSTCYRCLMSQYWLVKQEPTAYSWDQFVADGKTDWTGVRNFQARNNLRSMKVDDPVFYYHSVNGKAVVGIAKVTKEAFRDPTAAEGDWSAVELKPVKPVEPAVKVDEIKNEPQTGQYPLVEEFEAVRDETHQRGI